MGIWWQLSFCDPERPVGQQWLGGINICADTITDAITLTHQAGINPGGEIQFIGFTTDHMHPDYVGRLITDKDKWKNQPLPEDAKAIRMSYPVPTVNGVDMHLSGSETPPTEVSQSEDQ